MYASRALGDRGSGGRHQRRFQFFRKVVWEERSVARKREHGVVMMLPAVPERGRETGERADGLKIRQERQSFGEASMGDVANGDGARELPIPHLP
jgi:hypothetical protein